MGSSVPAPRARQPAIWYSPVGDTWTDGAVQAAGGPLTRLDVARLPGGRYVALGILGTQTETGEIVFACLVHNLRAPPSHVTSPVSPTRDEL